MRRRDRLPGKYNKDWELTYYRREMGRKGNAGGTEGARNDMQMRQSERGAWVVGLPAI